MFGSGNLGMGITFSLQNNASQPAAQAGASILGLGQTVDKAAQNIQNAANRIQSGIVGVIAVISMLIGPFLVATNASTEFNFQLSRAGAISNATAADMSLLKKAAFELGTASMYGATEVAKTEVVLAQAGFAVQQQLEMLPALTNLATAGVVDLDYAAGIASDTLFQFGLATKDMTRVSDVIVNAANMSNMSVQDFGGAMKYFGPQARMFNISLEEAAGYIEMMANSGMRGSVATRAFGTALAEFARPTKVASAVLQELFGNTRPFWDDTGNFIGLIDMTRKLQEVFKGQSPEFIMNKLAGAFNMEAIQEVGQLLNLEFRAIENGVEVVYRGADALEYFTKKNLDASGSAEKVAHAMMNNLKSDLKLMSASWETLLITIGDINDGPARDIVHTLREWILNIQQLMQTKFGSWLVTIATGTAVLAATMIALGFAITILIPAIWSMISAVGVLMIELAPFIAIAAVIIGFVYMMVQAFDEFQAVMNDEKGPATGFMGIMQKIGGVLMSVYEIWTSWNGETFMLSQGLHDALERIGILDFVLNLGTWIVRLKEFFYGVVEGLVFLYVVVEEVFLYVRDSFNSFFDTLSESSGPLGKLMGDLNLFRVMGKSVAAAIMVIVTPFVMLGYAIGLVVNSIEWLIANFDQIISWFPDVFDIANVALASNNKNSKSAWDGMFRTDFVNTFEGKGKMMPGANQMTGDFDISKIGTRQAEIMGMMGMRSDGQATVVAPPGSRIQETFIIQNMVDLELVHEKILTKQELKQARQ